MKRIWMIASLALLAYAAGCGSTSTSGRYITTEQSAEPSETASSQADSIDSEQPEQPEQQETVSPSTQIESSEPTEKTVDKPKEEPSSKSKKPADKAKEAEKSNVSVGEAVTDSIMDNLKDEESAAESPKAAQLKEPIEKIRSLVKDLKQHAENDDSALMKEVSVSITKDWKAMKSDVSSSIPDMAEFLDEKIAKLNELIQSDTIDAQAMLQIDYELYQAFRQLADKAGV